MQHTAAVPFHGDWSQAEALAIATLSGLGFRIDARSHKSIEFAGPGMTSTRQSPLLGATRIQLRIDGDMLTLDADLGGARYMIRFVEIFPGALCFGLLLVLMGVFWAVMPNQIERVWWIVAGVVGANALLWSILGRFIGRMIRSRTTQALDTLASNLAMASQFQSEEDVSQRRGVRRG